MPTDNNSKRKAIMRSVASLAFAASMFVGGSAAQANAVQTDDVTGDSSYHENSNSDGIGEVTDGDTDKNNDTTRDVHTNEDAELSLTSAAAVVSSLGDAGGYNVFVKGDYTNNHGNVDIGYGDQKGNIAVGGNVTLNGGNGNCSAGNAVVGGNVNGLFDNGYSDNSDNVVDFDATFKTLEQTSKSLAAVTPNGTVELGGWTSEIVFKGDNAELNVFTFTVDEFNALRGDNQQLCFNFDVPAGSKCLVNIVGEGSISLNNNAQSHISGATITNGTANNKDIIFNVPDAEHIEIGRSMGCLIAVNADVTNGSNGAGDHFEGTLICNNYEGYNEFGATPVDEETVNTIVPPSASSDEENTEDKENTDDNDNDDEEDSGNDNDDDNDDEDSGNDNDDDNDDEDSGNDNDDDNDDEDSGNDNDDDNDEEDSGNDNNDDNDDPFNPVDPTPTDPTPVDPTPVDPTPVDPTPVDPTPVDPTPVDPTPVDPTPVDPTPVDPTPVDPTPVDPTPVDPTPVDPTPVDPTPVDPTPVDPTPVDPTPVDPTPVDPTPVDPTPVDPTPVDPTPVDPTPVDPTPVDPTPVDPTPVDPTPVDPTPVDPTPVDPTPVDPTPVDPIPVDPTPVDPTPVYPVMPADSDTSEAVVTPDTTDETTLDAVEENAETVEKTVDETPENDVSFVEFDEPDVPLGDDPIYDDSVVEFDDPDIPLGDDPFGDDDDSSDVDSDTYNPKTGQSTTARNVTAAAAMASFLALLYASKARREAEKNN